MPELPEVETVVRGLRDAGIKDKTIVSVHFSWPKIAENMPSEKMALALKNHRIVSLNRRAKYIVITLDNNNFLLIHLRMTGKLRVTPSNDPAGKHDHVIIKMDDGRQLVYNDTRKFGRFMLVDSLKKSFADTGPEPLDKTFTWELLRDRLKGHKRMIKPLLLDQTCVAGLGNIYVDESLWAAGIHPTRQADTIKPGEIRKLHAAIQDVLKRAIAASGTTLGHGADNFYSVAGRRGRHADALQVFRRTGDPCPRCKTTITRIVVGQRGTHLCHRCQV
jgi:formamidopyrimidine-DNA glycosylase